MRRARLLIAGGCLAALPLVVVGAAWLRVALDGTTPSRSIGRPSAGHLEHGHVVPPWGSGYRTYSIIGAAIGRQYVHGRVRDTLIAAFAERERAGAAATFVVGETGWRNGGRLQGHRTHQNGLSVDLFMPVRDARGRPASLPTWPWNGFGYRHEFDAKGTSADHSIDFEELALLLKAIERQAAVHGASIERVIIAPEYVPILLGTDAGKRLGALASRLTRKPVWVRHDEHVHIDFAISGD